MTVHDSFSHNRTHNVSSSENKIAQVGAKSSPLSRKTSRVLLVSPRHLSTSSAGSGAKRLFIAHDPPHFQPFARRSARRPHGALLSLASGTPTGPCAGRTAPAMGGRRRCVPPTAGVGRNRGGGGARLDGGGAHRTVGLGPAHCGAAAPTRGARMPASLRRTPVCAAPHEQSGDGGAMGRRVARRRPAGRGEAPCRVLHLDGSGGGGRTGDGRAGDGETALELQRAGRVAVCRRRGVPTAHRQSGAPARRGGSAGALRRPARCGDGIHRRRRWEGAFRGTFALHHGARRGLRRQSHGAPRPPATHLARLRGESRVPALRNGARDPH